MGAMVAIVAMVATVDIFSTFGLSWLVSDQAKLSEILSKHLFITLFNPLLTPF
jgi:hypothetical protein